jgi:hypothetical protein
MGKVIVAILATLAALSIAVYLVGANRMASTAYQVPGTEHTPTFGITWTIIGALVIGGLIFKVVKGK